MEQLQVHSRSYLVRWVHVKAGESISWTLQPHKKSLNVGIFKHPSSAATSSSKAAAALDLPTSATLEVPPTPTVEAGNKDTHGAGHRETHASTRRNSTARDREAAANMIVEKLQAVGLKCVSWPSKCDADQVSMGRYDVHEGSEGMYGVVLDNTFSKSTAKTATFVLMTHPTVAPPKSGAQLRYSNPMAATSSSTLGKSPSLYPATSSESLPRDVAAASASAMAPPQLRLPHRTSAVSLDTAGFHTGIMHKRRRKKNQGYARRFFSLDFTSSTLSYYRNSHASALRGAIPLSLAAIGVDEQGKEFSIDSGAEVWHLRLRNKKDFEGWERAIEKACRADVASHSPVPHLAGLDGTRSPAATVDPATEREWQRVEELVGRVSGSRDAMRRLAQDTDPKYNRQSPHPSPTEANPFFSDVSELQPQRLPFWKRKASSGSQTGNPSSLLRRSFSAQTATPGSPVITPPQAMSPPVPRIKTPTLAAAVTDDVHERCMALLRDLDATVLEFSSLLATSKARRRPQPTSKVTGRSSMESFRSTDDFFDAAENPEEASQIINIRHSDELSEEHDDFFSDQESVTSSDAGTTMSPDGNFGPSPGGTSNLFPSLIADLKPVEVPVVKLRSTLPPPRQPPPSIIGFLRKNAGKDLSTVTMPVTANEPISLLQRLAEPLESADLLSRAVALSDKSSSLDRLVLVSAFAIATLASNRVKERALRKPFNPMLGETFELVRQDPGVGFRFIAEKVTHHPVRMAWHASSTDNTWALAQSPRPTQKFWGKSAELTTEGAYRLALRFGTTEEEHYSWTAPTAYLRNIIAGEKYIEPVGTMVVLNENTGEKSVATFKASGLFSGRSEDVSVQFYSTSGTALPGVGLQGKWPSTLTRTDTGKEIWRAGPLVPDAGKVWGFSTFAARLNEITPIEQGRCAPTDSRLRPDQRALEEGELDTAEGLKARLEERQRARRKVLETHGRAWKPVFFDKSEGVGVEGEEVWRLKSGREGYWDRRARGDWAGVVDVFEM